MSDAYERLPFMRDGYEGHQIEQTVTPFSNSVLRGPEGTDVGDLACELAMDPHSESVVTVSAWQPNEQQAAWLAAGAHLRMSVWQHPIPPLALAVESPFCPECEAPTVFVKSERVFACATSGCSLYGRPTPSTFKAGASAADAGSMTPEQQVKADFAPAPDEGPDTP